MHTHIQIVLEVKSEISDVNTQKCIFLYNNNV